jgi:hypothetical protein
MTVGHMSLPLLPLHPPSYHHGAGHKWQWSSHHQQQRTLVRRFQFVMMTLLFVTLFNTPLIYATATAIAAPVTTININASTHIPIKTNTRDKTTLIGDGLVPFELERIEELTISLMSINTDADGITTICALTRVLSVQCWVCILQLV